MKKVHNGTGERRWNVKGKSVCGRGGRERKEEGGMSQIHLVNVRSSMVSPQGSACCHSCLRFPQHLCTSAPVLLSWELDTA